MLSQYIIVYENHMEQKIRNGSKVFTSYYLQITVIPIVSLIEL